MDDYIPISYINALAYCPRRFYYEYVEAEMLDNEYVVEGRDLHAPSDEGDTVWREDVVQRRRVYIWSERLRLAGFADLVEWRAGEVVPVEYKRGRLGRWRNDHAQLCAQALCLEERLGRRIERGYLFSFAERRREEVEFSAELRAWTERLAVEGRRLAAEARIPPPIDERARCRGCSLAPLCLPDEVRKLQAGRPPEYADG
jgi:CRISPR-associated exonuclease Cas4